MLMIILSIGAIVAGFVLDIWPAIIGGFIATLVFGGSMAADRSQDARLGKNAELSTGDRGGFNPHL